MTTEKDLQEGTEETIVEERNTRRWHQYPGINLKFMLDFMRATGLNTATLCKMSNVPPQAFRLQLKSDDMKLSKAKQLIKNAGYKLDIRLYPTAPETADTDYIVTLPKRQNEEGNENLRFIIDFVGRAGDSQHELGRKLGVTQGAVFAWFRTDDIMISYIVKIKEVYKAKLEFRITENTD